MKVVLLCSLLAVGLGDLPHLPDVINQPSSYWPCGNMGGSGGYMGGSGLNFLAYEHEEVCTCAGGSGSVLYGNVCPCYGEPAEVPSGCANDYTAQGVAHCDAAWGQYGLNCAELEGDYGFDCSGCGCPGDASGSGGDSVGWQHVAHAGCDCGGGCTCDNYCTCQREQGSSGYGFEMVTVVGHFCDDGGSNMGFGCDCGDGCEPDSGSSIDPCSMMQLIHECDEFDYDQKECEAHWNHGCVWDDLNGCDIVKGQGCENDYTDAGVPDCDAAWEMYGMTCGALEGDYGFDCVGCACPGDPPPCADASECGDNEICLEGKCKGEDSCKCEAEWNEPGYTPECEVMQDGCTNCDDDPAGAWCHVANPGCMQESDLYGGGWAYCERCECEDVWNEPGYTEECGKDQNGCTNCDDDPEGSWCHLKNPGCDTESELYGGGWAYCKPSGPTCSDGIQNQGDLANGNENMEDRPDCHEPENPDGPCGECPCIPSCAGRCGGEMNSCGTDTCNSPCYCECENGTAAVADCPHNFAQFCDSCNDGFAMVEHKDETGIVHGKVCEEQCPTGNCCPPEFAHTQECGAIDWETAGEEDLCHCAMSIGKMHEAAGTTMQDCEFQSPFGDGWRGTHATMKKCSPQDPFDACMAECGNRWGGSETNMKLGGTAECMNDSAEDAIKFLLLQHGYLAEMVALMGNEEFKVMAEEHGIELGANATAHTVVHDMYHAEDGRAVAESIQNFATVKLQEKMEIGKFFLSLYEVMDESNKASCCVGEECDATTEDKGSSGAAVAVLVASISAALGAILM